MAAKLQRFTLISKKKNKEKLKPQLFFISAPIFSQPIYANIC